MRCKLHLLVLKRQQGCIAVILLQLARSYTDKATISSIQYTWNRNVPINLYCVVSRGLATQNRVYWSSEIVMMHRCAFAVACSSRDISLMLSSLFGFFCTKSMLVS
ncbi:hypothetical protein BDF19DRAFT_439602 [Syncephalis fuscata]|nr:hypothetical protein BDF19DRAFT_439602 [Syncephalis fuscata]